RLRLTRTLLQVLEGVEISIEDLITAVSADTEAGQGMNLRNLSPYGIAIRSLFNHQAEKMHTFLRKKRVRGNARLLLTVEMEVGRMPTGAKDERFQFVGPG
ncbi:MAG: hypothetical protein AVDCRST_MAG91-24, partial [uncultured Sphingomonadaceae bacterium]